MEVLERGAACEVEDEDCCVCVFVVAACDCTEFLLACGVPDLELYSFRVNAYSLESEINPYSR
jgi:hypothetical protein